MSEADTRLAVYGTLSPGRSNHGKLAELRGAWTVGVVRGRLVDAGWGAALGSPGIVLDPDGPEVEVHLLESTDLPAFWARLDAFEGPGYRRVETRVASGSGVVTASIYEVIA